MSDALIRKIDELTTTIDDQAELISALTEQRDAAVAELTKTLAVLRQWETNAALVAEEVEAAIAMKEGAKG